MQTLLKQCATVLVLAAVSLPAASVPAMAERDIMNKNVHYHDAQTGTDQRATQKNAHKTNTAKVKAAKAHRHHHAVGHRFRSRDVVVVNNWHARGLPRPGRNEVYVIDGRDIYLAAAATLAVKALIN